MRKQREMMFIIADHAQRIAETHQPAGGGKTSMAGCKHVGYVQLPDVGKAHRRSIACAA